MSEKQQVQVIEGKADIGSSIGVSAPTDISWLQDAITNPNTDVSKLERLEAMYERMTARSARAAYDAEFAKMQAKMPVIDRRGKIVIKEKGGDKIIQSTPYALFEDINEAIKPILAEHGFAISFRLGLTQDGRITVTGILSGHGHREETTITLMHDSTGSKNAVQAVGSSTSYGKRYVLCALLNISTRGEDDDGKKGGDEGTLSEKQAEQITALIAETKSDIGRFLKWIGAESISDIPASKFDEAVTMLSVKKGKNK